MRFLRTLFGQVSHCSNCGKQLREWKRRPCPVCGGLPRTHERLVNEMIGAKDKAGYPFRPS